MVARGRGIISDAAGGEGGHWAARLDSVIRRCIPRPCRIGPKLLAAGKMPIFKEPMILV